MKRFNIVLFLLFHPIHPYWGPDRTTPLFNTATFICLSTMTCIAYFLNRRVTLLFNEMNKSIKGVQEKNQSLYAQILNLEKNTRADSLKVYRNEMRMVDIKMRPIRRDLLQLQGDVAILRITLDQIMIHCKMKPKGTLKQ